ncbi:MAG: DUF58 domain-containing protein [Muribaculaceae bacterium]|nr:DUF58 domain-containing protein [Muribaculaceae bacterium]
MDSNELLRRVRKIEIKTRGLSQEIFAGEYHSAFKGRGMTFSEVREYQYGDDVRDIDWNVTARYHKPFVKVYEEERELTVMLVVDVSAGNLFGAVGPYKRDVVAEVAATLAFSAIQNNDKVGMLLFTDRIERFIPPKKGRKHILLLIRELLDCRPQGRGTNVKQALEFMTGALKKRCTTFVLSDFVDAGEDYSHALSLAAHKHDVMALQVYDKREADMPDVGLVLMSDAESGAQRWVDTSSRAVRTAWQRWWYANQQQLSNAAARARVDVATIATDEDYVKALMAMFKTRNKK